MQLFISDVLGQVATTRLTSQVEIAVDNPTAAEAEVEGGAAGLQGFPLLFFCGWVKSFCYHNCRIGGHIYINSLSLFLGFSKGTRVLTHSHVSQIQMFFSFTWMPFGGWGHHKTYIFKVFFAQRSTDKFIDQWINDV